MQTRRRTLAGIGTTALAISLTAVVAPPAFAQTTFAPNSSTPPTISTFAGDGHAGFNGDGIPATSANLTFPTGVAEDSAGDVYLADTLNFRVRLVKPNGTIRTVAGDGIPGYNGDGGKATKAELLEPESPALDSQGTLYIADSGNNRVRMVDKSGVISTFAGTGGCGRTGNGGKATKAELCDPTAVAVMASGDVLIADTGNNEIRVVTPDGKIHDFAGNGSFGLSGNGGPATKAQLGLPTSVAADSLGNVYLADTANNQVREVLPSGIIQRLAGRANGVPGYRGDGGAATNAALDHPEGVGVDSLGDVYIADSFNFRIRVVIPKGDIFTYAGTGVPGYRGDGGPATKARLNTVSGNLAVDANNVYFGDTLNERVRVIKGGPPPNIAESPFAILLPLSALALLVGGFLYLRRRSHRGSPAIA